MSKPPRPPLPSSSILPIIRLIVITRIRHNNPIQMRNLPSQASQYGSPLHQSRVVATGRKSTHKPNHISHHARHLLLRAGRGEHSIRDLGPHREIPQLQQLHVSMLGYEPLGAGLQRALLIPLGKRLDCRLLLLLSLLITLLLITLSSPHPASFPPLAPLPFSFPSSSLLPTITGRGRGRGGDDAEKPAAEPRRVEHPPPPRRPLVDARAQLGECRAVRVPQAAAYEARAVRLHVDVVACVGALAAGAREGGGEMRLFVLVSNVIAVLFRFLLRVGGGIRGLGCEGK